MEDAVEPEVDTPNLEPSNIIQLMRQRATSDAIGVYDEDKVDPDKAAKAVGYSKATGVPAPVIHEDMEEFERKAQQITARNIVSSSPHIQEYINSHPLAAKISSDDWGPLSETSSAALKVGAKSILGAAFEGFKAGFGRERLDEEVEEQRDRLFNMLGGSVGAMNLGEILISDFKDFSGAMALVNGVITGGSAAVGEAYKQLGGNEAFANRLTRDLIAGAQVAMSGQGIFHGPVHPAARIAIKEASKAGGITVKDALGEIFPPTVTPYLKEGKEPPYGLSPALDVVKEEQLKLDIKLLKDLEKYSDGTATVQRSADAQAAFLRIHLGDQSVGIDSTAIRKLYGDKSPTVDDGVLGWLPGIEDQLRMAEPQGGDIIVPLADYVARTPKEVRGELYDFIRTRSAGPNIEETKFFKEHEKGIKEAAPEIDDPGPLSSGDPTVDGIRQSAGLESVLDPARLQKLKLERTDKPSGAEPLEGAPAHNFSLTDAAGKDVGEVSVSETNNGKSLYVNWLGAQAGRGAFGPRVLRDILAQIKQQFPNAEEIGGFRVSGAREKAGATAGMSIKLDAPTLNDLQTLMRIMQVEEAGVSQGLWFDLGHGYEALFKPTEMYTKAEQSIISAVDKILGRITPQEIETRPAVAIRQGEAYPQGLYNRDVGDASLIVYSVTANDPKAIARHEAIHHLRTMDYLKPEEWDVIEKAAIDNNWMKKYDIDERYPKLDTEAKLEEAAAEAFAEWGTGVKEPNTALHAIWEKLKDLIAQIRQAIREATGKEPTFEELFQKIERGEVGRRDPHAMFIDAATEELSAMAPKPRRLGAFKPKEAAPPKEPELPQDATTRIEDRQPYTRGMDIGVTQRIYNAIMDMGEKRLQEDLVDAQEKAIKQEEVRQSRAWKVEAERLRPEIEQQVYERPDIAADQLLTKGMYHGEKFPGRTPKLDPASLTEKQRKRLPEEYFAEPGYKEAYPADEFARLFGIESGDALVERLAALETGRKSTGLEGKTFINRLVRDTTELRLQEKFKEQLGETIQDAKDRVLSDRKLRWLPEEVIKVGEAAGAQISLKEGELKAGARELFDKQIISTVNSDAKLREADRLQKKAEDEIIVRKDPQKYLANKGAQYTSLLTAKLSLEHEKAKARFDESIPGLAKYHAENMDQGYRNMVHDLMYRVGLQPKRTTLNLAEEMLREGVGNNLAEFKLKKFDNSNGMDNLEIPEFLLHPNFRKPLNSLTVEEFRGLDETIRALAGKGRAEKTVIAQGEKELKENILAQLGERVKAFPQREFEATPTTGKERSKWLRTFLANSTTFETFARRMDRLDPYGVWQRYLMYPLAQAANYKDVLGRKFAKLLGEVGELKNSTKAIERPPIAPELRIKNFTVDNLQVMIHNMGNKDQWDHFAKGWGADPDVLKAWVFAQSAKYGGKELFDRAQKLGDKIFHAVFEEAKDVYHTEYGVAPRGIELAPIQTPYGEYKGWYHPQIPHPEHKVLFDENGKIISAQSERQTGGSLYDSTDNFHARTFNGYTKKRTGAYYPMDLTSKMIPIRLQQMLHDIAFRPALIQAEKLLNDKKLKQLVSNHYGKEYSDGFMPYLRGIAGQEGIPSEAFAMAQRASEFFRQNVISSYIGFNIFTALKHGPTAAALSMWQVGMRPFLKEKFTMSKPASQSWLEAAKDLYGHQMDMNLTNEEFVNKWSEEVGRRRRFWQETIGGQTKLMYDQPTRRERIIQAGSWLVSQSDMWSVKPTWLAAYRESMLQTKDNHGLSVQVADAAVRAQHGSTAVTNQPALVRGGGPLHGWLTSIYGFWGTIMQRRIELAHLIADTYKMDVDPSNFKQVYKNSWDIATRTFAYVIWPAMIEEAVTGLTTDDRRGWGAHMLDGVVHGLGSSVLYARDFIRGFSAHGDIGLGLATSVSHDTMKTINDLKKGKKMFSKENAGRTVEDLMTTYGQVTGKSPKEFGHLARYGIDYLVTGQAKAKGPGPIFRGVTRGKEEARKVE